MKSIRFIAILYITTLIVMVAMDFLWLGVIAHDFYDDRIGSLMEFHAVPAVIFYLLYVAGVIIFVSRKGQSLSQIARNGALLGLFGYGTYDLTNLATLRDWPVSVTIVDMAWGTFDTALAASAGWWITQKLVKTTFQ